MVKITEQLIRKKSEHNELIIGTLEELSLHQENIDKIENVQDWCRDLKILLLQSNLISKIENLWKLKRLEYLNLAVNNIEIVENLEKLESLNKLDLTLNFIGDLRSIDSLKNNYNLRELVLTGNPCSEYPHYRTYVIATLPQLTILDSQEISTADKLSAKIQLSEITPQIEKSQIEYKRFRELQKVRVKAELEETRRIMETMSDPQEQNKYFWDSKCEHSPESRTEIANHQMKLEKFKNKELEKTPKPSRPFINKDGRPFNINESKMEFKFQDLVDKFELELFVPKFCDTELISIDMEINYIRITVKGKLFQLELKEEIKINDSKSQRSQITGHLLVQMPKLNYDESLIPKASQISKPQQQSQAINLKSSDRETINGDLLDIPDLI